VLEPQDVAVGRWRFLELSFSERSKLVRHGAEWPRERAESRQRARQAAKQELRSIVKRGTTPSRWRRSSLKLSRHASALDGDERANLEARVQRARELAGGQGAADRFLKWALPSGGASEDEDVATDETGEDPDDENDWSEARLGESRCHSNARVEPGPEDSPCWRDSSDG